MKPEGMTKRKVGLQTKYVFKKWLQFPESQAPVYINQSVRSEHAVRL